MVRIYALLTHSPLQEYDVVSYYLDPAAAASAALSVSKRLPKGAYALVQQLDVYPDSFNRSHLLRVDGLA